MAVAVAAAVAPRVSLWDAELGRLLQAGPTLPDPARAAVHSVLTSLLDDPDTDAAEAADIVQVLDSLQSPRYLQRVS